MEGEKRIQHTLPNAAFIFRRSMHQTPSGQGQMYKAVHTTAKTNSHNGNCQHQLQLYH